MEDTPRWVRDIQAMQREIPFGSIGFTLHDEQGQVEVQGQMTKHKGLVGKLSVDKGQSFKFDHATNQQAKHLIEQVIKTAEASGFTGALGITINFKQNPDGLPSLISQVVKTEHEEINYLQ